MQANYRRDGRAERVDQPPDGPGISPVGAENLCHLVGCSAGGWSLGPASGHMRVRSWPAGAWDDLRLVGLKQTFLIVSRAVSLLGLSRREAWWKDAEILMLRHQLAVAERERPGARARLTWPDRALLALLAGALPIDRLAAMRLIVTPGTILRWHRDIVRRRWSRRSRQGRSGRPATHRKDAVGGAAWDRRNSAQPGPSRRGAGSMPAVSRICGTRERVVGLPAYPR